MDFLLGKFPFNVVIFGIKDAIFGEKIKYEKEELNLIYHINEKMDFLNDNIGKSELRTKINLQVIDEKYEQKINYCNTKLTSIENRIYGIEDVLKNILKEIKKMKDKK